jgi:hypothetical protein
VLRKLWTFHGIGLPTAACIVTLLRPHTTGEDEQREICNLHARTVVRRVNGFFKAILAILMISICWTLVDRCYGK